MLIQSERMVSDSTASDELLPARVKIRSCARIGHDRTTGPQVTASAREVGGDMSATIKGVLVDIMSNVGATSTGNLVRVRAYAYAIDCKDDDTSHSNIFEH